MSAENVAPAAPAAPASKLLAPGDVIDGRYRVMSFVAGGGMASVYRATHVVLEQVVAIKVISPLVHAIPGMAKRFLREAKAATRMKGEHVAHVSDVGTMPDGAPYIVMEYLDGKDLEAVLESGDEIAVEDAVDYVLQACEALAEVHALGVVHRDLKPANLVLTRGADGLPFIKLIDFGISQTNAPLSTRELAGITQPDVVMGSPRYMAPEQMESVSKADARSDIYGIGAVLYELLTRRPPNEGDTLDAMYMAAMLGAPQAPSSLRSDVPRALDEVILRCLRSDPAERYIDVSTLARALAPFGPAGSELRAEHVARVFDATVVRSRQRGGKCHGAYGDAPPGRRRVSSSAHSLRKRRVRLGAIAFAVAVLSLGGLAAGSRALHVDDRANGFALVAPSAEVVVHASPSPAPPMAEPEPVVVAPTPAVAVRAALVASPTAVARVARPYAHDEATASVAVRPAPRLDERTLFEDRK